MLTVKWPTIIAIVVLTIATVMTWYWVWGLLFLYWAVGGVRIGEAFIIETIHREDNPVLFWAITAAWSGFGLWYVITDLVWRIT